jgi:hypothetical protein
MAKPIFKTLSFSWQNIFIIWSRSFKRSTIDSNRSKAFTLTSSQSRNSEKNSVARPMLNYVWAAKVWLLDNRINLKVWQTVTLQPFGIQRLIIPLWKDLYLRNIYSYCHMKPSFGQFMILNEHFLSKHGAHRIAATPSASLGVEATIETFPMRYCMAFYLKGIKTALTWGFRLSTLLN